MDAQTAPATTRRNRVLLALAAAWMVLSLAIGGAAQAGGGPTSGPEIVTTGPAQP